MPLSNELKVVAADEFLTINAAVVEAIKLFVKLKKAAREGQVIEIDGKKVMI
jgi:hypothetical protein